MDSEGEGAVFYGSLAPGAFVRVNRSSRCESRSAAAGMCLTVVPTVLQSHQFIKRRLFTSTLSVCIVCVSSVALVPPSVGLGDVETAVTQQGCVSVCLKLCQESVSV